MGTLNKSPSDFACSGLKDSLVVKKRLSGGYEKNTGGRRSTQSRMEKCKIGRGKR